VTSATAHTAFVVDDDVLVRTAIHGMLMSLGLRSEALGTTQAFPEQPPAGRREGAARMVKDATRAGEIISSTSTAIQGISN
jgi:FixJ family two-component response regulator